MNTQKNVGNYSILLFQPYVEREEVVGVGVVLYCPEIKFFDYEVALRQNFKRVVGLFPKVDKNIYWRVGSDYITHLRHTKEIINVNTERAGINIFKNLVEPTNSWFCYKQMSTILFDNTDDVENWCNRFNEYPLWSKT